MVFIDKTKLIINEIKETNNNSSYLHTRTLSFQAENPEWAAIFC